MGRGGDFEIVFEFFFIFRFCGIWRGFLVVLICFRFVLGLTFVCGGRVFVCRVFWRMRYFGSGFGGGGGEEGRGLVFF